MADLIKDDTTDQMVVCPLVDADYALVTTAITTPTITLIINNGSDVDLSSTATLSYSESMGGHKLVIPAAAITATGRYCLCIQASGIQNYNLDGLIVSPQSSFATAASISALNNISVNDILDSIVDRTHHTTHNSLARLLYVLYCGSIGSVVNTQTTRTIRDSAGNTLVTNTISSTDTTVTRSGGHET